MSLNFNRAPYFNDYDPENKFYRILFRPGFAVQTRELNQLQSILQDQISRFGDHVFTNGSLVIPGAVKVNTNAYYAKVSEGSLQNSDLSVYEGAALDNGSGGTTGTLIKVSPVESGDPLTLHFEYLEGEEFSGGDTVTITLADGSSSETVSIESSGTPLGRSTLVTLDRGVYFINDHFTIVNNQTVVVSKYTSIEQISGEVSVGLLAQESIITPEQDVSLTDNAQGSFNETAPGAHRFKVDPVLVLRSDLNDLSDYIELVKIVRGEIAREVRESEYTVLGDTLARRTFEESGNYVVKNFNIGVDDHPTDNTKLELEFEPGKAYIQGYRVETTNTRRIDIDKARTTATREDSLVSLQLGEYFHIKTIFGQPELFSEIKLYSDASLNFTSNVPDEPSTQIGTATVRALEYDVAQSATEGETVIRIHLFNFEFTGSNTVADVKTIYSDVDSPAFAGEIADASIDSVTSDTVLQEASDDVSIYSFPFSEIDSVSNVAFNFIKKYDAVLSGTEIAITTPIASEQFRDEAIDFIVYVTNVVNGSTNASVIGDAFIPDSVTLSSANKTATLDLASAGVNDSDEVSVYAVMFKSPGTIKNKTPVVNATLTTSATPGSTINLGFADVYQISSIVDGDGNNYAAYYDLDTGQRDTYYDIATLNLVPGRTAPEVELTITFSYFNHGSGDFFVADSYDAISYENIPTYTSESGVEYRLADSMDFRPIINSSGGFTNSPVAFVPDSEAIVDFDHYLPRIDRVCVSRNGEFSVIKGTPALDPELPKEANNSITIYNIKLNPYTFESSDVVVDQIDHPRYRMKDIAALEQRIENLEYYTSLSLVERDALSKEFIDKFKSGILVDPFIGHDVGDASKQTYRAVIDPENGELRPEASTESISLKDAESGTNYQVTGNVVTLPYTEVEFISQDKATRIERIQPYISYLWEGDVTLTPDSDSWVSQQRVPDTTLDGGTRFTDAFRANRNRIGNVTWGGWRTFWVGANNAGGRNIFRQRVGQRIVRTVSTQITRLGDRVVDRSLIPFIRERDVQFSATGLKPRTTVIPYFEGVDVSAFVTPNPLVTDALGSVSGTFSIPNTDSVRFRTGERVFEIKDADPGTPDDFSTIGQATYSAQGILESISTFFESTRVVSVGTRRVTGQTQLIGDPLAQSFLPTLDGGVFISSIDLYFGPEAADNDFPVTVEIRNMENGSPGAEIAPYGKSVLPAASITGSTDASVATRFSFPSPVFLEEGIEYCFVVKTDSQTLTVWQSVMGQTDVRTGERIVKQPFLGSLFKSQNDRTWTPAQLEDLTFEINRAQFDTNVTGEVIFENTVLPGDQGKEADPYLELLTLDPFTFTSGSNVIEVFHQNHSFETGDTVQFTASNSSNLLGVPEGEIFGVNHSVTVIDPDNYTVTVTTNATSSASVGGAAIFATQHVGFSVIYPVIETLSFPDTSASYQFKGTSKFGKTDDSGYIDISINEDNRLTFPRTSVENDDGSILVKATLSSVSDNVSPYLDIKRFALLATENRVTNTEDTNNVPESDDAFARYITKPVELVNPANEIQIFFDANRPPAASIDVFYKVRPVGDGTPIGQQDWIKIENALVLPPATDDYDSFSEYSFNQTFANDFNVYAIKIVMRSASEAQVPRIRDLRVIALKG